MKDKEVPDKNVCENKTVNTVEGSFKYRVCEKEKVAIQNDDTLQNNKKSK